MSNVTFGLFNNSKALIPYSNVTSPSVFKSSLINDFGVNLVSFNFCVNSSIKFNLLTNLA